MLKKGDRGPDVVQLQNALLELGESLPRWGADGDLGDETLRAVSSLFSKQCRKDSDYSVVSDDELLYIYTLRDMRRDSSIPKLSKLVDRRQFAGLTNDYGPRAWDQVRGWCLHQTACYLSSSKDIARCDKVGAHWVVYPDGRKFRLHDINRKVIHGNGWNNQTIGIEIDGLFAGIEGDANTVWDDKSTPYVEKAGSVTVEQIEAVREIIYHDRALIRANGGTDTVIVSHRQSSKDRRNDPGSKVWKEIALPLLKELSLSDGGVGFEIGGYPIPQEWDSSKKGYRY